MAIEDKLSLNQDKTLEESPMDADLFMCRFCYKMIKNEYTKGILGRIRNYFKPFPPFKEYCEQIYSEELKKEDLNV